LKSEPVCSAISGDGAVGQDAPRVGQALERKPWAWEELLPLLNIVELEAGEATRYWRKGGWAEVAEAPGGEGEGHDQVGVADLGVVGAGDLNGSVAGLAAGGVTEGFELGFQNGGVVEGFGQSEMSGFHDLEKVLDEVELGDVVDVDG